MVAAPPSRAASHAPWVLLAISVALNGYLLFTRSELPAASQALTQEDVRGDVSVTTSHLQARQLGGSEEISSSAGNCSHAHCCSEGDHEVHQHDALLFMFIALFVGVLIMNAAAWLPWVQDTVFLFVVGMILSFIMSWAEIDEHSNKLAQSYYMWMRIDPHLVLFTLLPPLLAGDAMTIDTSVAQHVAFQCLYLAGPGVVVQAFAVAGFLCWYLEWELLVSLITGSILCATDPVAVVALLKELGASPTLTVQIQGESLLNDGTAIVLFTICYNMLSGEHYDFAEVVMFLVQVAMMAWGLGMFIGYFFFSWIRATGNIFNHHCSIIQISLTLLAAYWSFIVAEGLLEISGVLSTVACSLVLAQNMWPHLVSQESMHNVWHTLEALGNVLIFFLAGSLTGRVMVKTPAREFWRLLVVYIVLVLVRSIFIFASRPILRRLSLHGMAISLEDAVVMSWGGLRGAVGLALAIQVYNDRAPNEDDVPQMDEDLARQVLFLVGGVALLTTIINATTAPLLVKWLGITALPRAQLRLLKMLFQHLMLVSVNNAHPPEITQGLTEMLKEMEKVIDPHKVEVQSIVRPASEGDLQSQQPDDDDPLESTNPSDHPTARTTNGTTFSPTSLAQGLRRMSLSSRHTATSVAESVVTDHMEDSMTILGKLRRGEEMYRKIQRQNQRSMLWVKNLGGSVSKGIPEENLLLQADSMVDLMRTCDMDQSMAQVVTRTFLKLVNAHYWKQIECRDLRPGSEEAKILLTSIQVALSSSSTNLRDFGFILKRLKKVEWVKTWWNPDIAGLEVNDDASVAGGPVDKMGPMESDGDPAALDGNGKAKRNGWAHDIVASGFFNVGLSVAIVANGLHVAFEVGHRKDDDYGIGWLLAEAFFTVLFIAEFLLKIVAMGCKYFKLGSNVFDFSLVVLGTLGCMLSLAEYIQGESNSGSHASDISGIIRISRVFRVLRFLRLFRLFHAKLSADKEISADLAQHMLRISTFLSFIGAHLASQSALVKYFGRNGVIDEVDEAEIGRCIVQSQVCVYKAISLTVQEEKELDDKELLNELKWAYERKEITEGLEEFVMSAYRDGAITAREAESIVHPLHRQITECLNAFSDTVEGIRDRSLSSHLASPQHSSQLGNGRSPQNSNQIVHGKSPQHSSQLAGKSPGNSSPVCSAKPYGGSGASGTSEDEPPTPGSSKPTVKFVMDAVVDPPYTVPGHIPAHPDVDPPMVGPDLPCSVNE